MNELGVTDQQFVEACHRAEKNPVHKKIVDQILAVENFMAFKRLMVKRNQELNRQAILMYEKQQQAAKNGEPLPKQTDAGASKTTPTLSKEEAEKQAAELKEVLKVVQSQEKAEEEEMMKKALEESQR